jgi:hypothetical protein
MPLKNIRLCKVSAMKLSEHRFHALLSDHVLFPTYRWAAWFLAALVIILLPNQSGRNFPVLFILLLLLAGITLVFTLRAEHYVRLFERHPIAVPLVDSGVGVAMMWLSGGLLPFLPYALGGLVLPLRRLLLRFFVNPQPAAHVQSPEHLAHADQHPLAYRIQAGNQMRSGSLPRSVEHSRQQATSEHNDEHDTTLTAIEAFHKVAATEPRSAAEQGPQAPRQIFYAKLTPGTDVDLSTALDQIVSSFNGSVAIPTRLHMVGSRRSLHPAKHRALVRLAQEALLNIQQHAHAHSASLTLYYQPDSITLTVEDDGVGLLDGTYRRPGVHALRAMYYRLSEFDGKLEVFEGDEGGVTVRGTLPLDNEHTGCPPSS